MYTLIAELPLSLGSAGSTRIDQSGPGVAVFAVELFLTCRGDPLKVRLYESGRIPASQSAGPLRDIPNLTFARRYIMCTAEHPQPVEPGVYIVS
jgi:hypothetical protein